MKNIRKYCIWYLMFSKRLLHKTSFVILLCLIPAIIPLTNWALTEDAGVLRVILCCEDADPAASRAVDKLINRGGIIQFSVNSSSQQAISDVSAFKADAAWIFSKDMTDAIDAYVTSSSRKPLVRVVQREETVPLQISRELLHGALYEDISFSIYKNFVNTEIPLENPLSDDELHRYYNGILSRGDIIETKGLDSSVQPMETNYLTAPLRGILSLIVMLCTMAAVLYFLKDQQEGKYDRLPPHKRLAPAFGSCLSASMFASVAVYIAFQISGLSTGLLRDFVAIILYALSATGFCLVLCILFRSPGKMGAVIPGLLIAMLVLSPIFFVGKNLQLIRLCLPSYHYLHSTYNNGYFLYMLYYCIGVYGLAFILNMIVNHNVKRTQLTI